MRIRDTKQNQGFGQKRELGRSISARTSSKMTSIAHNERRPEDEKKLKGYGGHIDWSRTDKNVFLISEKIEDVYHQLFHDEVLKYNSKQKRKDRKIDETKNGYLKKIKNEQKKGTCDYQREFICQFGTKEDEPFHTDLSNEMFEKYLESFQERYKDLRVYSAIIHNDEATAHMHVNFVPVGTGYKNGMGKRPSFSKVLKSHNLEFKEFFENERDELAKIMKEYTGEDRKTVGSHDYIKPNQYRELFRDLNEKDYELNEKDEKLKDAEKHFSLIVDDFKQRNDELERKEKEVSEKLLEAEKKLSDAKKQVNEAYRQKQSINNAYNEKWHKYKDKMSVIREKQDKLWNDSEKRDEWDRTALKLRNSRDIMSKTMNGKTWLDVVFNLIATIQVERYENQLQKMNKVRQQANEQLKNQRQKAVNELQQVNNEKTLIAQEIKEKTYARDNLQSEVNALKNECLTSRQNLKNFDRLVEQKKDELRKEMLPFQIEARQKKDEAYSLLQQQKELLEEQNKKLANREISDGRATAQNTHTIEQIEQKQQGTTKNKLTNDEILEMVMNDIEKDNELTL